MRSDPEIYRSRWQGIRLGEVDSLGIVVRPDGKLVDASRGIDFSWAA